MAPVVGVIGVVVAEVVVDTAETGTFISTTAGMITMIRITSSGEVDTVIAAATEVVEAALKMAGGSAMTAAEAATTGAVASRAMGVTKAGDTRAGEATRAAVATRAVEGIRAVAPVAAIRTRTTTTTTGAGDEAVVGVATHGAEVSSARL
jgi:hypothetical protein